MLQMARGILLRRRTDRREQSALPGRARRVGATANLARRLAKHEFPAGVPVDVKLDKEGAA